MVTIKGDEVRVTENPLAFSPFAFCFQP